MLYAQKKIASTGERIVFAWMRMSSAPVRIVCSGVRIVFAGVRIRPKAEG